MLTISKLTEEKLNEVKKLDVNEDQRGFLAPTEGIIARADIYKNCNPKLLVIESDGKPIGLALVREFDEEPLGYDLQQFMIDKRYQGRGYGFAALKLILEDLKKERHFDQVEVCVKKTDLLAIHLYEKVGFKDSGYVDEEVPDSINMIYYL